MIGQRAKLPHLDSFEIARIDPADPARYGEPITTEQGWMAALVTALTAAQDLGCDVGVWLRRAGREGTSEPRAEFGPGELAEFSADERGDLWRLAERDRSINRAQLASSIYATLTVAASMSEDAGLAGTATEAQRLADAVRSAVDERHAAVIAAGYAEPDPEPSIW